MIVSAVVALRRHVRYELRLIFVGWKGENRIELKVLINKSLFYGDFNYREFCCFTNDSRFTTPNFTFHCAREGFFKSFKPLNGRTFSFEGCKQWFFRVRNRTYICYNYFPSSQHPHENPDFKPMLDGGRSEKKNSKANIVPELLPSFVLSPPLLVFSENKNYLFLKTYFFCCCLSCVWYHKKNEGGK